MEKYFPDGKTGEEESGASGHSASGHGASGHGTSGHGGDIYRNHVRLDFSVNVNPAGPPAAAVSAYRKAARMLDRYPDPESARLKAALAVRHGLSPEMILPGNGASALLGAAVTALRPESILLPVPSFSGYPFAVRMMETASGAQPRILCYELKQTEEFRLTEEILEVIRREQPQLLILANPNNPTGACIGRGLLREILHCCESTGTRILLDECFLPLTQKEKEESLVPELRLYPDLMIVNALTKSHAMPALRIGYLMCADIEKLRVMRQLLPEWPVSFPAEEAALAALSEKDYLKRSSVYVGRMRKMLSGGLARLGLETVPGDANFLLFRSEQELYGPLLQRGILIRQCGNFTGLDDRWYRIAVRKQQENRAFLAALAEITGETGTEKGRQNAGKE